MELFEILGYSTRTPGLRSSARSSLVDAALDRAVTRSARSVANHVNSIRRRTPDASPEQVIATLAQEYATILHGWGGVAGAAAAAARVGPGLRLALSTTDLAVFLTVSSVFALSVANVHGIEVENVEDRRALLSTSILGSSGAKSLSEASERSTTAWGTTLLTVMPASRVRQVTRILTSRFVRWQIAKHVSSTAGRALPYGIGAAVGLLSARSMSHRVVQHTETAFGPAPAEFSHPLPPLLSPDQGPWTVRHQ